MPSKDREIADSMRQVVFQLQLEHRGDLIAQAESLPIHISAPSLEELHHEAREALIAHFGASHATDQVRIRRRQLAPRSSIRSLASTPRSSAARQLA